MEEALKIHTEAALKQIAGEQDVANATIVLNSSGNEKGDGYLGIVETAEITNSSKKLSLIVKTATLNTKVRELCPITQCFISEIHFYGKVVPTFNEFLAKKGAPKYDGAPKCYYLSKDNYKEVIILENLKVQGYEVWDRKRAVDKDHTEIVMESFAKLHALSLGIKSYSNQMYDKMVDGLGDSITVWFDYNFMDAFKILAERNKGLIQDKNCLKVYSEMCTEIETFMMNDGEKDPYAVVGHGDCWINNMMFQYKMKQGKKTLSSLKLIDFQLSRSANIICDISHFLCTCASEDVWNDLDHYLNLYYKTLASELVKVGCDSDSIMTYGKFKEEFRKHCRFGLVMSSFFIRVMLMEGDEAPDIQATLGGTFCEKFTELIREEEEYKRRMRFLIHYFYKHGFF